MPDPAEPYLEDVLVWADLALSDERTVRAELREHLHQLLAEKNPTDPKEIYTMFSQQFGKPKQIGKMIARSRGRLRTYLKKLRRGAPLKIAVIALLVLGIHWQVAEAFYVPGDCVAPTIPQGSRVLVYKLVSSFSPGDVVAYRTASNLNYLGIIQNDDGGVVTVERHEISGLKLARVQKQQIIGRVVLNTR